MNTETVLGLMREAMVLTLMVSAPLLAAGLIIGVIVSIFQTVTQIRETTLTFVPKIIGVMVFMVLFGPWMMSIVLSYTSRMIQTIQTIAR